MEAKTFGIDILADLTFDINKRLKRIERLAAMAATNVWGVEDVALLLNVSTKRIYNMTSAKEIPHYKKGTNITFLREEIEAWRLGNKVHTDAEVMSEAVTYTSTHKCNK